MNTKGLLTGVESIKCKYADNQHIIFSLTPAYAQFLVHLRSVFVLFWCVFSKF